MKPVFFFVFLALSSSSSAFAQSRTSNETKVKNLINNSKLSKCADGSAKEFLDMGPANLRIDSVFIAKSNAQDFVTIVPEGLGARVGLHYCAPKRTIIENGKEKKVSVPIVNYRWNLGQLNKRDNCAFSDIVSGYIDVQFQGINAPSRIFVRPIIGSPQEEAEYTKLCSDKARSSRISDEEIDDCFAEPTPETQLAEEVSKTVKSKYSCDMTDIMSGHMMVGSGINVYVDEINKKAEIATTVVYPGAQERIDSVLKQQADKTRYELQTNTGKESFQLLDKNTGILSRTYNVNGQTGSTAFKCTLTK